jgi:hypothetical protein
MVLMLVAGVVVDRMLLLEVMPTSRLRELLHMQPEASSPVTPVTTTPQGQGASTTTPKNPTRVAPRYAGSAGATVSGEVEMVSGPTYSLVGGFPYIRGVIRNKSSKNLPYVSVTFAVYDSSGNKLDPASTYFGDLGPGETWRYEALILDSEAASYKLVALESY